MVAPEGTTIQMPCRAQGSPTPVIKWLKDGHEMTPTGSKFDIRPDGSLILQNVSEDDEGMYKCVADNGREQKSAEARFALREARDLGRRGQNEGQRSSDESLLANSYLIGRPSAGDEFVLVALEEATEEVDKALNSTIDELFAGGQKSITNSTPRELLRIFRFWDFSVIYTIFNHKAPFEKVWKVEKAYNFLRIY